MAEVEAGQFRQALERMHGGAAKFIQSVPIVVDPADNPEATLACAWSSPIEVSTERRFFVLDILPITSRVEATRAAIVAERRQVPR